MFRNAGFARNEKLLAQMVGPHRVESIFTAEHASQSARIASASESADEDDDEDEELELVQKNTRTRKSSQEQDGRPGSSRGPSATTFITELEAEEQRNGADSAKESASSPASWGRSRQSRRSRSASVGLTLTLPALEASVDLHSLRPTVAMMQRNSCLFMWRNKKTFEMT